MGNGVANSPTPGSGGGQVGWDGDDIVVTANRRWSPADERSYLTNGWSSFTQAGSERQGTFAAGPDRINPPIKNIIDRNELNLARLNINLYNADYRTKYGKDYADYALVKDSFDYAESRIEGLDAIRDALFNRSLSEFGQSYYTVAKNTVAVIGLADTGYRAYTGEMSIGEAAAAFATAGKGRGVGTAMERSLFSSAGGELAGVERASKPFLNSVSSKRAVTWATPGSDAERFLNMRGAEAAAFGPEDILLRPNPSKAAVLEEFLHGTHELLPDLGPPCWASSSSCRPGRAVCR